MRKRQKTTEIRASMRELIIQLSLLNHQVSANLGLKDIDLDSLNLIDRHGPLSPSAMSRRAGLHPATLTGSTRQARAGWLGGPRT